MRKSDQRTKAYGLLNNRLQYAIDHSSEYHLDMLMILLLK